MSECFSVRRNRHDDFFHLEKIRPEWHRERPGSHRCLTVVLRASAGRVTGGRPRLWTSTQEYLAAIGYPEGDER